MFMGCSLAALIFPVAFAIGAIIYIRRNPHEKRGPAIPSKEVANDR